MPRYFIILFSLFSGLFVYAVSDSGPVRNHLPDLLWAFAICHTAAMMYRNNFHPGFVFALLLLPFITEVGQWPGLFRGTFDVYDLILYGGLYSVFFFSQIKQSWKKKQRASSPV